MVLRFLQYSDLSAGFFHVACMLVYDPIESTIFHRSRHVMRLGWILISLAVATVRLSVM